MLNSIKVGLSTLVIAGSMFITTPAQAATEHCDSGTYPNKVELWGDDASVHTDLASGTQVCIKAGNQVTYGVVDYYGYVTNTSIRNQQGVAKGISYYAWGGQNPS